jgi:hypothetical protein
MKVRLPMPIFYSGSIYTEVEIEKPKAGVLADTKKLADSGDTFSAVHKFVSGCIVSIIKNDDQVISDKVGMSALVRAMAYRSAEFVTIKSLLLLDPDDGIEGIYPCPRCGYVLKSEKKSDENGILIYDTRDRISEMEINFHKGEENVFRYEFSDPVIIMNSETKEAIEEIYNFDMVYPTLGHCISAQQKHSRQDELRFQFGIYIEALDKVNEEKVDNQWKGRFGMSMFEKIPDVRIDLIGITKKVNEFGLQKNIQKRCLECDKEWSVLVNTSNFFEFGLRTI